MLYHYVSCAIAQEHALAHAKRVKSRQTLWDTRFASASLLQVMGMTVGLDEDAVRGWPMLVADHHVTSFLQVSPSSYIWQSPRSDQTKLSTHFSTAILRATSLQRS